MNRLIRNIIVSVGALTSLVGLILTMRTSGQSWTGWQIALMVLAGTLGIASIYLDVVEHRAHPVKLLKRDRQIHDYMYAWIKKASGVAIFSRDLSWVTTREMRQLLEQKARDGELTIVLPKSIELSEALHKIGADVLYYEGIDYVIRSRFTVVNTNRHDTRVAIGRSEGDEHRIEEFSAGNHPAFYLTQDIMELMKRFATRPERADS